jgi:hypothetical protein
MIPAMEIEGTDDQYEEELLLLSLKRDIIKF